MATIPDYLIRDLARTKGLIEPWREEQQNPASYDVTLGPSILVEEPDGWRRIDIASDVYEMPPRAFVLAHTAEVVRVPADLEATFQLKSSRGREGYEHALAGYIDPGFSGQITLELTNLNRYRRLPLVANMKIGQLRFMKMYDKPHRLYSITGRYNNDMGAVPSKG